jgi:tryptophan-rich sensory protein
MNRLISLAPFVALVTATASSGALFPPGTWYLDLAKPAWTPPSWVFGPVWTLLYLGIAVAGWQVWRSQHKNAKAALVLWGGQLVLNAVWSWLFFGMHQPGWAFVEIALLLGVIGVFVVKARPVSRIAAALFVPYALWVLYATVLNFAIWRLNVGGIG